MASAIFWNKYRGRYVGVEVSSLKGATRAARSASALRFTYNSRAGQRTFSRSHAQGRFIEV